MTVLKGFIKPRHCPPRSLLQIVSTGLLICKPRRVGDGRDHNETIQGRSISFICMPLAEGLQDWDQPNHHSDQKSSDCGGNGRVIDGDIAGYLVVRLLWSDIDHMFNYSTNFEDVAELLTIQVRLSQ